MWLHRSEAFRAWESGPGPSRQTLGKLGRRNLHHDNNNLRRTTEVWIDTVAWYGGGPKRNVYNPSVRGQVLICALWNEASRACCRGGGTLPNCCFLCLAERQQIRPVGSIIHRLQLSAPLILIPCGRESGPYTGSDGNIHPPAELMHGARRRAHLSRSERCYIRCCYFWSWWCQRCLKLNSGRHLNGDKTTKHMGVKIFKFINLKKQGRDSFFTF